MHRNSACLLIPAESDATAHRAEQLLVVVGMSSCHHVGIDKRMVNENRDLSLLSCPLSSRQFRTGA